MSDQPLIFTLWDVGHGISIWLQMPNGTHQWIDLGNTPDFSPSEHVYETYGIIRIENLFISHPDQDHLADLPNFSAVFEDNYNPRFLTLNKTLPDKAKYGDLKYQYQIDYKSVIDKKPYDVDWSQNPLNSDNNGGVEIKTFDLAHGNHDGTIIEGNNTSVVVFIRYQNILFVCPGDIETLGWDKLWSSYKTDISPIIDDTDIRVLVAPHHGRESCYSDSMMTTLEPHVVIISDVYGDSETHPNYYSKPKGIQFPDGGIVKYYSTKRAGRVKIAVSETSSTFEQYDN